MASMIVKEGIKGMIFSTLNAGVFIMSAFAVFKCDFNAFTSKLVFFGIFILPLLIVLTSKWLRRDRTYASRCAKKLMRKSEARPVSKTVV